jgi:hypothetical protein
MLKDNLNNIQQEVFITPTGLKEIIKLDNAPLYGSDHLNEKYIEALSKIDKTTKYVNKVQGFLTKKILIPCFLQKGLFHHIAWRLFGPAGIKSIAGFFNPVDGRVVILISNDSNIFSYVSNNFLANLTVHELSHRAAFVDANKFYHTFREELISFYRSLFCEIFNIKEDKLDDKTVFSIISFLFRNIEMIAGNVPSGSLIKYSMLIQTELRGLSNLKNEQFMILLDDYIKIIAIFLKDLNYFFDLREEYSHILNPIYRSYKKALGVKNSSTVAIQELVYPSEVIALLSEYGQSNITSKVLELN